MSWKMNRSPEEKLATQLETVLRDIDREVLLDELLKNIISIKRCNDKLKIVELTQEEYDKQMASKLRQKFNL